MLADGGSARPTVLAILDHLNFLAGREGSDAKDALAAICGQWTFGSAGRGHEET